MTWSPRSEAVMASCLLPIPPRAGGSIPVAAASDGFAL